MSRTSLSITLEQEVIRLLDKQKTNKSELVNRILKKALLTEEGILGKIEFHKEQIRLLQEELDKLKQKNTEKIENISEGFKNKLKDVKRILDIHPEKLYIWKEILNKDYNGDFDEYDILKLIKRWT